MKIIQIDLNSGYKDELTMISEHIRSGKTVVFPTETCYGIAIDPTNQAAIDNLYKIKNRPHDKNISFIFKDIKQASMLAKINEQQEQILNKNLPGPFTFILESKADCPIKQFTIGVRIPNFGFTRNLSNKLNIPYSATSANISGMPSCYKIEDFIDQIKSINGFYPDLIVDAGELPENKPSTVVDITKPSPLIIRQGDGILK